MTKNELKNNIVNSISTCFQSLTPEELEILNNKKTQITYLKGENLFKQGAFAPYVMLVLNGLVKLYLQIGHEKQINIRIASSGDFLAFSSIFGESVYNYSALALKDSLVCMIDKEGLKNVLLQNPSFAMKITSRNFKNENLLLDIIKNLSYKQMRGKLATTLIYLSSDEFLAEEIFQYLSRQEIADFASISTESVIKFLKEFEKEGILKLDGKDVMVLNKNKLEEIALRG